MADRPVAGSVATAPYSLVPRDGPISVQFGAPTFDRFLVLEPAATLQLWGEELDPDVIGCIATAVGAGDAACSTLCCVGEARRGEGGHCLRSLGPCRPAGRQLASWAQPVNAVHVRAGRLDAVVTSAAPSRLSPEADVQAVFAPLYPLAEPGKHLWVLENATAPFLLPVPPPPQLQLDAGTWARLASCDGRLGDRTGDDRTGGADPLASYRWYTPERRFGAPVDVAPVANASRRLARLAGSGSVLLSVRLLAVPLVPAP